MNIIKSPQDNIEAYLYNEVNIQLYREYVGEETERLIFFNLLFKEFEFFCENNQNYLKIENHFKIRSDYNLEYSSESDYNPQISIDMGEVIERHQHYEYLVRLIDDTYPIENRTGVLIKTCEQIEEVYKKTSDFLSIITKSGRTFNWFLESMSDLNNREKINTLIDNKYTYLKEPNLSFEKGIPFNELCDLEIQKINELIKYEIHQKQPNKFTPVVNTLNWQGTTLQFTELTKALFETKLISPELLQNEFFNRMKLFFNVDEFKESDKIKEIVNRTNTPTPLINILELSLNNYRNNQLEKRKNK
jgi:hypothetical protein